MLLAVAQQVVVDELRAAVAVDALQIEGQPGTDHQELLEHPLLSPVRHRTHLRPLRAAVGGQQRVGEFAGGAAAGVADQVQTHGADGPVLPLAEGADRDLQQQRPGGLGMASPAGHELALLGAQQPIDGRGADVQLRADPGRERDPAPDALVPALVVRQPQTQRGGHALCRTGSRSDATASSEPRRSAHRRPGASVGVGHAGRPRS